MKRKQFLKNTLLGAAAAAISPAAIASTKEDSTYEKLIKDVGFNHLPSPKTETKYNNHMKTILHKATTRGHANHGWLNTHHTFSFAGYYNPERMHFGVLRVLNDDEIAGGTGFGTHPHDNMEIITIPLEGAIEHRDSMGNHGIIQSGEVQVMSAGTGIRHSEYNANKDKPGKFLQIWLFPNQRNVTPRYDQQAYTASKSPNQWVQILSPNADDDGVWIHQQAWFHLGHFSKATTLPYTLKQAGNGLYVFVIEGSVKIGGQELSKRDGLGIYDFSSIDVEAQTGSKLLLMEVPMAI